MGTIQIDAPEKQWLSSQEAAAWLGISLKLFKHLVSEGAIPAGQVFAPRNVKWSRTIVAIFSAARQMHLTITRERFSDEKET